MNSNGIKSQIDTNELSELVKKLKDYVKELSLGIQKPSNHTKILLFTPLKLF